MFFEEKLVGDLRPVEGGYSSFTYAESWLDDERGFAISASLPLSRTLEAVLPAQVFFSNLLPEGHVREAVANQLGLPAWNDFALLEALGGECAGALTILPEGTSPEEQCGSYERLAPETIARLARSSTLFAEVTGWKKPRLSLAGAQDKLPVRVDESGHIWLPLNGAPSTHILKMPSRDFHRLPTNETLITALARAQLLASVDIDLIHLDDIEVAVVRRYDRLVGRDGKNITRVHQEDLCQGLGLPPTKKYEGEGGPGFADAMKLVRECSTMPLVDTQQLLRWLIFDLLVGNADGHAKNISMLRGLDGRGARLAPFYDLICTGIYRHLDRLLAMGIGGERDPKLISNENWESLSRSVGVGAHLIRQEVERQATSIPLVFDEIADEHVGEHGSSTTIERLRKGIEKQCRHTLELLDR